jgi:Sulfotransferase family
MDIRRADPIFILGVMPRSGTNFLWDLLRLHPGCAPARDPIREDFFLQESDLLVRYSAAVRAWWDPIWGEFGADLPDRLHEALGEGLISFLWVDRERRLLAKTPSVRNLDRFFTFFPSARLLILVRDGRSVAQSCMATFGWDLDTAARRWREAADEIRRFDGAHQELHSRYRVVRYEDLVDDLTGTLSGVLDFLELDRDAYEFGAAAQLPVRGSSAYFGPDRASVHWEPIEKDAGFDPKERWRSWTPRTRQRFDWIAGEQLRHFGYGRSALPGGIRQSVWQTLLDRRWQAATASRRLAYRLRVRVGTASRPLRQRLGLIRGA